MKSFIGIAVFIATFTAGTLASPTGDLAIARRGKDIHYPLRIPPTAGPITAIGANGGVNYGGNVILPREASITANGANGDQEYYAGRENVGKISINGLPTPFTDKLILRDEVTALEDTTQDAKPKGSSASSKAAKKQASHDKYGAAAAAHKATTNLPNRNQQFQVPGGPTYSGKDVRKAIFDSHMENQANKGKSKTQLKKSPLKSFGNSDHRLPNPNKPQDIKSINNMKGQGQEFPIGDSVNKGPARVITQKTKAGHTTFKGVVAHDVSRPHGSTGYNDHFQIKPTRS